MVEQAKAWAIDRHGDQRYGEGPFWKHLESVESVVLEFFQNNHFLLDQVYPYTLESLRASAWLHDVVEDTDATSLEIEQRFGPEVTKLVWAVTDEPGKNRRERFIKTWPKILEVGNGALALKLADRIANARASIQDPKGLSAMYQKEYPEFQKALRKPAVLESMWAELDRLLL